MLYLSRKDYKKGIMQKKKAIYMFCGPKKNLSEYQGKCWNGQ